MQRKDMPFGKGGRNGKGRSPLTLNKKKRHHRDRLEYYGAYHERVKRRKQEAAGATAGPPGKGLNCPRKQLLRIEKLTEGLKATEIKQIWAFEAHSWDEHCADLEQQIVGLQEDMEQAYMELEVVERDLREQRELAPQTPRRARKPVAELHPDNQRKKLRKLRAQLAELEAKNLLPEFSLVMDEDAVLGGQEDDEGEKEVWQAARQIESDPKYKIDRLIQVIIHYIAFSFCSFFFIFLSLFCLFLGHGFQRGFAAPGGRPVARFEMRLG